MKFKGAFLTFAIVLGLLLTSLPASVVAQGSDDNSRDLYLKKTRPGIKVTIERERSGQTDWVSPRATFRSGDKIRLHLAVNFTGYLYVINSGTTGKKMTLFPYDRSSNRVTPTTDYIVPRNDWFVFDNNDGVERLTILVASRQFTSDTETSRDLVLGVSGNEGYAVYKRKTVAQPVALRLGLTHR